MNHNDIIHRLQIIRDFIRFGDTFQADVSLDSLQRMIHETNISEEANDERTTKRD
jgi:hypothetical protein